MEQNTENDRLRLARIVTFAILLFGLYEGVYGLMQLWGFAAPGHSRYPATGTFYNPGPFCGFLAVILPIAVGNLTDSAGGKLTRCLSLIYLLICAAVMPALGGRTGWIAATAGMAYTYLSIKRFNFSRKRFVIFILIIIPVIASGAFLLYLLKPESAAGRLLLWRIGVGAVSLKGCGWRNVGGALGDSQERFFMSHPDSEFAEVAGSPEYAFNEFIQTGVAFGVFGLLLFISIISCFLVIAIRRKANGAAGAIISFIIVCYGSYPLQFPEFIILMLLIFASVLLSPGKSPGKRGRLLPLSVFLSAIVCGAYISRLDYSISRENERWQTLKFLCYGRMTKENIRQLDSIATLENSSARMLFDYGKALRERGMYRKSNTILKRGLRKSSDPMFLNLIGRNYQDMKEYGPAERYYLRSGRRLPSRLYPKYLLAKLYAAQRPPDSLRLRRACRDVLDFTPKVTSPATARMKNEIRALLN